MGNKMTRKAAIAALCELDEIDKTIHLIKCECLGIQDTEEGRAAGEYIVGMKKGMDEIRDWLEAIAET